MGHMPHVLVDGPWDADTLALRAGQSHHLSRVLRVAPGDPISYTDGKGTLGVGTLLREGSVARSDERSAARPPALDMAVAPPAAKDRVRFVVEKLAELGVSRLLWLRTDHGANRVPAPERASAWAQSALEQSRGAWLMEVGGSLVDWTDLDAPVTACDPGAGDAVPRPRTVAIGPEGGWAEGEIPAQVSRWGLSSNVLRVETAAIVAAALVLAVRSR